MRECWKHNIPKIWEERNVELPEGVRPEDLIKVPDNAQYFAALGAVEFGKDEDETTIGRLPGLRERSSGTSRSAATKRSRRPAAAGLVDRRGRARRLQRAVQAARSSSPPTFKPGQVVEGFIGIDGGSTSTKAVLLDKDGNVLCKAYQLSKGNPIEDTMEIFAKLRQAGRGPGRDARRSWASAPPATPRTS